MRLTLGRISVQGAAAANVLTLRGESGATCIDQQPRLNSLLSEVSLVRGRPEHAGGAGESSAFFEYDQSTVSFR